jgi:cytochrome P450
MSISPGVLRPAETGFGAVIKNWVMGVIPAVMSFARWILPIGRFGKTAFVVRYDDVREVFLNDPDFKVPYEEKLAIIMGGEPFFLGMADTKEYQRDLAAMRAVVQPADIPSRLMPATAKMAEEIVASAGGRLEVVDKLVRKVTFDVLCEYFGTPTPPDADLRVWATRLFEFQFADPGNDKALRREVDEIAPKLRAYIDSLIAARRVAGPTADTVLDRCLRKQQEEGSEAYSDKKIRSALIGFIVGGLPQPPMVAPQALEQLLRRPDALQGAQEAARAGDRTLLSGYIFEAMRFDPLAPALPRIAQRETEIAAGTRRATKIPKDTTVYVAFSSAMMDPRRVRDPARFNPRRLASDYMHFGQGLHTCFGLHMNMALLPLMLEPLLKRDGVKRAAGADGHLVKNGAFAEKLVVEYKA